MTNLYSYVGGDPVNLIDPEGKAWRDVNWGNVAGGGGLVIGGLSLLIGGASSYIAPPIAVLGTVAGVGGILSGSTLLGNEWNHLINGTDEQIGGANNPNIQQPNSCQAGR